MNATLTRELLAARPSTPGDDGWADTAAGRRTLVAALREGPRARRRYRIAIAGVSGATVLAGGATALATITSAPTHDPQTVLCNESASLDADGAGLTLDGSGPAAAARACATNWARMFPGTPQPQRFAVCVYPARGGQPGGGQVAFPARVDSTDDQVCRALGTVPAR